MTVTEPLRCREGSKARHGRVGTGRRFPHHSTPLSSDFRAELFRVEGLLKAEGLGFRV